MTIVSVVSCAGSGSHRKETRVEKRHAEEVGFPVLAMIDMQLKSVVLRGSVVGRNGSAVLYEKPRCTHMELIDR